MDMVWRKIILIIDGNKRTAFMVMYTFLGLNGYSINVPEMEVVVMMERLATDQENQESLAKWLEENSVDSSNSS
jgi:death-on-curing protein